MNSDNFFDIHLMKHIGIESKLEYKLLCSGKNISSSEGDAIIALMNLNKELPFISKSRLYLLNKSIQSLKKHSTFPRKCSRYNQKERLKCSILNILKTKNKNEIMYAITSLRNYKKNINQENCIEGLINLLKTQLN